MAEILQAFSADHSPLLFDPLANRTRPIHSDFRKEIGCDLFIDPSVDFDFVDSAQTPDLVFDLFGTHNGYPNDCNYGNNNNISFG
jgi:hypothetical protein